MELLDAKRGWQVRSRNAWLDKTLDERLVDRAIATMASGRETNPLGVQAMIGEIVTLGPEAVRVPVQIALSPQRLTLVEDAAGIRQGRFRVFLAAQAPNGDRTVLREKFFDVTPLALDAGLQQIVVNVDLEPGDYTIGLGVRDEIGTEESYLALRDDGANRESGRLELGPAELGPASEARSLRSCALAMKRITTFQTLHQPTVYQLGHTTIAM